MMDKKVYSERLPNHSSIFSAELLALFLALDHVETDSSHSFYHFCRFQVQGLEESIGFKEAHTNTQKRVREGSQYKRDNQL